METLQKVLRADVPRGLRAAAQAEQEARATEAERLAAARAGQWHNAVVVGSRPRAKAAQAIVAHSRPGESPWLVVGSLGAGVLAAFDDRLLLVKTGIVTATMAGAFGGARVSTFNFHDITGIEYNSGLLNGVLEILTPSYSGTANRDFWRGTTASRNADSNDPFVLSNTLLLDKFEHKQTLPHLNELRHRITQAKRSAAAPQPAGPAHGVADEIARLASLRETGALTEEEFQIAKRNLLGT